MPAETAQRVEKAPQPATEAPQAPPQGSEAPSAGWRGSRFLQGIQDSLGGEVRPLRGGNW
jgi:hypothetical protein